MGNLQPQTDGVMVPPVTGLAISAASSSDDSCTFDDLHDQQVCTAVNFSVWNAALATSLKTHVR